MAACEQVWKKNGFDKNGNPCCNRCKVCGTSYVEARTLIIRSESSATPRPARTTISRTVFLFNPVMRQTARTDMPSHSKSCRVRVAAVIGVAGEPDQCTHI